MPSCITTPEGTTPVPQLGRSVSIEQAAQVLGVSRRTIYNHIKNGRLATLRTLGGSQRVLVTSLPNAEAMRHPVAPWPQGPALV
jgi:excisionase family DNA binding protein